MKVYLIKRFDENYISNCSEEDVNVTDYVVGVCLTKERAFEVAKSYLTSFTNKIAGIDPYDDGDEEWSLHEYHEIFIDLADLEVIFSDEHNINYTVSFLIEEMEVTE